MGRRFLLLRLPVVKGLVGELLVVLMLRLFPDKDRYHRLHNVTLPTIDGTTQIDHVVISGFGIFVIETKNMWGWIFGSEKQAEWTQKIFKKTVRFQNPLRQNYKHTKAIEAVTGIDADRVHSVVVFVGDATRLCPRCGEARVIRQVRSGVKAGEKFWGCSAYPKCRAVQKITV